MKYVVDVSVGFKWEVPEDLSLEAQKLHDEPHELIVPDIFHVEISNALMMAERRKRLSNASVLMWDLLLTSLRTERSLPLLPRAMEIAVQTRSTIYDCI